MAKLTLSFKGRVIDVFHIERDKTEIGRNDDCTIPIDSLAIAPVQAVITRNDDQSYLLQAQEEAFPVLVNHEKTEEITLNHGDVIQVGKHTLSFAEDVMDLSADLGPIPANDQLGDCAMIARREDGYFITFLEGPNPPRINRKPMGNQAQLLTDGDIIDVGGTQMQFHD